MDSTKKRTRQNSECQITRFVRFLYLRLDFCPRLFCIFINEKKSDSNELKNAGTILGQVREFIV